MYECKLRGLLKKEGTDVLVGDRVTLDSVDEQARTARISGVLPRTSEMLRPKVANIDQVLILYSLREPQFDPHQLDRYLTHVELAGLTPIVCISKTDLAEQPEECLEIQALYQDGLGYPVFLSSIRQPETVHAILRQTEGKTSVLAGPSGSGKSSLLNVMNPDFQLKVGEVSEKIARGQHTTRHVELLPLGDNTYIADTPGFSNLKFTYVLPTGLEAVYRDFAPYRADCGFSDCLHVDEAGCAVLAHLDDIPESRYTSYLDMLAEARLYKQELQSSSAKQEYGAKHLSKKGGEEMRVLRLQGKHRDASRRVHRQRMDQYIGEMDDSDAFKDEES